MKIWFLADDQVRARARVFLLVPTFAALTVSLAAGHAPAAVISLGLLLLGAVGASRIRAPDEVCGFCARARREVNLMVAGPNASICDDCVTRSQAVVLAQTKSLMWALLMLEELPKATPRSTTAPLFDLCRGLQAERARLVRRAFDFDDYETAARIVESVPEGERTPSDWINLGCAYEYSGRAPEAARAAERALVDPTQRAWALNNAAVARLSGTLDPAQLEQIVLDCQRARAAAAEHPEAGRLGYLVACTWGTGAEALRQLGRLDEATTWLDEADQRGGKHWWRLMVRARLTHARDANADLSNLFDEASALVHPESTIAKSLAAEREKLTRRS